MHLVFSRGLAHFLGTISMSPPGDAAVELPVGEPLRALHEEAVLGVVPALAGAPGPRDLLVRRPGDLVDLLALQLRSPGGEEHLGAELVVEPGHDVAPVVQGDPPFREVLHVQKYAQLKSYRVIFLNISCAYRDVSIF